MQVSAGSGIIRGMFRIAKTPVTNPIRLVVTLCLVGGLAACGSARNQMSGSYKSSDAVSLEGAAKFANGPIGNACNAHNRRVANNARCGCIQAAANLTLSQEEQMRAVRFFGEPELLQAIKLSDTPPNERFWYAWARFADTAEELCQRA